MRLFMGNPDGADPGCRTEKAVAFRLQPGVGLELGLGPGLGLDMS